MKKINLRRKLEKPMKKKLQRSLGCGSFNLTYARLLNAGNSSFAEIINNIRDGGAIVFQKPDEKE